jgi:alanine racemase
VTGAFGRSGPDLGDFRAPTLETLPEAVARNVAIARARTRARIMAVVKADGYGHGACTVAQAAVAAGAEWLGMTDIAEASELRATALTVPILTWLNPSGVDAEAAAAGQIDIAIGSVDELEALLKHASSSVRVHMNLDTGMAREGCPMPEWDAVIARARQEQRRGKSRVVGLMGHLPLADQAQPEANEASVVQMRQARRAMMAARFGAPLTHLVATSGTLCDPTTHFGMVCHGAGLVGIDPSGTTNCAVRRV